MLLNVGQMRNPHHRLDGTYQPVLFEAVEGMYRVAAPVRLGFDIDKDGVRFRLVGQVATTLEMTCSRCLEPFQVPVAAGFDLRYVPHSQNVGEGEREIEEDDLATAYYEGETIDLGQLMREQFFLVLPMKPLCSEGCRGLCLQCGANLNQEDCGCRPAWEDPRLAALKHLLKTDESNRPA